MPFYQRYTAVLAALTLPLLLLSLFSLSPGRLGLLALFTLGFGALSFRTYTLSSGVIMTAASALAVTAMVLFDPLELYSVVIVGMLVIKVRQDRPWVNTLVNITAVGTGLVIGSWLYHTQVSYLGIADGPLIYRLLPFLLALLLRDLVNHGLIAPVVAARTGAQPLAVLRETMLQGGPGQFTMNAMGLAFADLVSREGPFVLLYIIFLIGAMHATIAFYVKRSEIERAAEQDGLTLVHNRAAFEKASQQRGWAGLVVVIDCDQLKLINDTRGHQAGDQILQLLARSLMAAAEGEVYRYGGDEFVVLLKEPARLDAIQRAIELLAKTHGANASLGTCQVPDEAPTIPLAFALADQRMYAVKEARR